MSACKNSNTPPRAAAAPAFICLARPRGAEVAPGLFENELAHQHEAGPSQHEIVLRGGVLRWTDELKGQPPLALNQLSFVARNRVRSHLLRLDATPPPEWGQTFSLMAQMREPLLDLGPQPPNQAPWHNWSGEVYGDFPAVDVSRLRAYVDLSEWGVEVRSGQGALRLWADVTGGRIGGVTADLALKTVQAQLGPRLLPRPKLPPSLLQSWCWRSRSTSSPPTCSPSIAAITPAG